VAGAIYSGFAMVLVLAIPLRKAYGLQGLITDKHLDNCAKVMLATDWIVAYATSSRPSRVVQRQTSTSRRPCGIAIDRPLRFFVLAADCLQTSRRRRRCGSSGSAETPRCCFCVRLVVLVGMWLERFVIIVSSLGAGLPAVFVGHLPCHALGLGTYLGTIGLFLFLSSCSFDCCP